MNKKELRKEYKAKRNSLVSREALSEKIAEKLLGSEMYKNAGSVLAYCSFDSEVETREIIRRALEDKKRVALPKCEDTDGNMSFYYITSLSDLSGGMYGINEPPESERARDFTTGDICLVPGLSFDKNGYRLGYGKGYYDRFLSGFGGISIGLCYEECLCELLPRDEFDKKTDYIITDLKIYDLK